MKGVVPNYLSFKEPEAIYIFSTGAVVSRGGLCVTLSGEVAPRVAIE